jgi:hypothetical protein
MTTEPASIAKPRAAPKHSALKFPVYALADSVLAAKAIHEKGGGAATNDHLAAFLGYRSSKNGAFVNRVASAKLFGLIEGPPTRLVITGRAQKILMPINVGDPKQALIDAFLSVPLYAAIYRENQGKELPPEFGMKNALRNVFGVVPGRIDEAYRAFMASADTAGFFEIRGSKTQLIMPMVTTGIPRPTPIQEPDAGETNEHESGNGGGGGNDGNPPRQSGDLRGEYISALIGLLRDKGAKGEVDEALMSRIEKLLGEPGK